MEITVESGWQQASYTVGPGQHAFNWMYLKDTDGTAGEDAAWLDQVTLESQIKGRGLLAH